MPALGRLRPACPGEMWPYTAAPAAVLANLSPTATCNVLAVMLAATGPIGTMAEDIDMVVCGASVRHMCAELAIA